MLAAIASDGTQARAWSKGRGKVILVLHPGMDDGSTWHGVGAILAERFRVIIAHRRPYRLDLPPSGSMAAELDHIRALVRVIDEPILLVGHSSGAVAALEALVDMPSAFVGAVLYDPPITTHDLPFAIPTNEHVSGTLDRARSAVAAGKIRRAFAIFAREVLRLPRPVAWLSAILGAAVPRWRELVPAQIEDGAAIESLGNRLEAYAGITIQSILLTGENGQGDLHERIASLAVSIPKARRVSIPKQGHSAHRRAPEEVARVIEVLADDVF